MPVLHYEGGTAGGRSHRPMVCPWSAEGLHDTRHRCAAPGSAVRILGAAEGGSSLVGASPQPRVGRASNPSDPEVFRLVA